MTDHDLGSLENVRILKRVDNGTNDKLPTLNAIDSQKVHSMSHIKH